MANRSNFGEPEVMVDFGGGFDRTPPSRPLAFDNLRNAGQKARCKLACTPTRSASRWPALFTPAATTIVTLAMRPSASTFCVKASNHTYGWEPPFGGSVDGGEKDLLKKSAPESAREIRVYNVVENLEISLTNGNNAQKLRAIRTILVSRLQALALRWTFSTGPRRCTAAF